MSDTKAKTPGKSATAEPRSFGRPNTFAQEIADEICTRVAKGEPFSHICRNEHMPAVRTVSDWKTASETFSANFACARDIELDQIAADCLDIADESMFDTIQGQNGNRANTEWISRSKLRLKTRLKLLAKWDPEALRRQDHAGAHQPRRLRLAALTTPL